MTDRIDLRSGVRPAFLAVAILAGAPALSACASGTVEQSVPTASAGGEVQGEGRNTGTFPNLNVPPNVAAEQLTPEQKQTKLAQLEADKRRLAAEGASARSTVDAAQLKTLGETHAQEALKSIEGE
jgi:Spy/CpxP family protein refolding chaperone